MWRTRWLETGVLELLRTIPSSIAFTHGYATFSMINLALMRQILPCQRIETFNSTPHCAMGWDLVFFMIWKSRSGGAQRLLRMVTWKQLQHLLHVIALADADSRKMRVRHSVGI